MANETAKHDNNYHKVGLGITEIGGETKMIVVDDTTGRQKTDSIAEIQGYTEVGDGTKTVTTAGTAVALSATSVPCKRVFIQAHESNAGTIVVGGATVVAALNGRRGKAIFPTNGEWFNVSNLNLLYIDSTADGDKVNFYYEN